jgi:predicted hydrocarbon binding protein
VEDYIAICEHPNNFEVTIWKESGRTSSEPLCFFNAGYSSGWCSVASGVELDAEEIPCEAKGDAACRFIMFPASRRYGYMEKIAEYQK